MTPHESPDLSSAASPWRGQRASAGLAIAAACALLTLGFGGHASAQEAAAPDVQRIADVPLPNAPAGFTTRTVGVVTFEHHALAASTLAPLIATADAMWQRVCSDLGADPTTALRVRVGRSPEEMASLAPDGAPPPEYAVGVAYPALGLVLLTLSAPDTWERPDLDRVLLHELAHVATHRASGGNGVPRWLDEGIAIHVAGERSLERVQVLWEGTVGGRLIALDDLSDRFPSRPSHVSLAYAQSADFVAWILRRSPDGPDKLRAMLGRIARGQTFEDAVRQTWTLGIGQLELEWRAALTERYGMLPLLLGSGLAWAIVGVLVVLAWVRRRRDTKVTLERWGREEALVARERAVAELRQREALAMFTWPGEHAHIAGGPRRDGIAIRDVPRDGASHDGVSHGAASHGAASHDGAPRDATPRDDVSHDLGARDDSGDPASDKGAERPAPDVDDEAPNDVAHLAIRPRREDEVPSVEWDGGRHTLH